MSPERSRPRFSDYLKGLITEFTPLAGDRYFGEDEAIVGGFGRFEGEAVCIIGQEKGADTESRIRHNFGMARPEGYRKAARLMELADRFGMPVLALVDTAGAFPGVDAEERGQAEAIARSTDACLSLGVPNVAVVIGEGGSGGAIAIATANKVLMLEHAIYTVASPEAAASILWRDPARPGRGDEHEDHRPGPRQVRDHRHDRPRAARRRASRSGGGRHGDRRRDRRGAEVAREHERRAIARGAGGEVSGDRAEGVGSLLPLAGEGGRRSRPDEGPPSPPTSLPEGPGRRGEKDAMLQTWRWFGPDDPVSLEHAAQAGAAGIVTALHDRNRGEIWSADDVAGRRAEIEQAGLVWSVVESIAVGEEIKTRSGAFRQKIDNYKQSIRNAARAGVKVFCYNFMAITDWTRTDLAWRLPNGGAALRFDAVDFAAYDLFILQRDGAEDDYASRLIESAMDRFEAMSGEEKLALERTLIDWLPAREFTYDRDSFRRTLAAYKGVGVEDMRSNLVAFVAEIAAVAEEEGARLAIHPDDPAFPIFGLPRVLSTAEDVRKLFAAVPSRACGVTLCAGSFGSNAANDLVAMAREFAPRVHFVHLRNVKREPNGSFFEADHLGGDVDLVGLVAELMTEERRRRAEGRADAEIPMRPDHGHLIGDDRLKRMNPGYSFVGRLKGLAELRGVMQTVEAFQAGRLA